MQGLGFLTKVDDQAYVDHGTGPFMCASKIWAFPHTPCCHTLLSALTCHRPSLLLSPQDPDCRGFSDLGDYWYDSAFNPADNRPGACVYVRAPYF